MQKDTDQEMPRRKHRGTVLRIVILVLYIGVLAILLNQKYWDGYAIPRYHETRGYAEKAWVFRRGEQVLDSHVELPAFRKMKTGERYSISVKLTYDGNQDSVPACFFFVDHMFCRATLDGEELFSYMPEDIEKRERSRSPGNVYASFLLPKDCQGKEFTVEFVPALSEDIEFQFPNPIFGDYSSIAVSTFRSELPHNLVVVLSGFLGVAAVLFSTLALPGAKYREGLFIGIFATLFSLYNLTESDFDFYVISNPYYTYFVDYITFSTLPIFLLAFLRERLAPKQKPIALAIILVGVFMFLAEVTLHFTGIMDMREFLPIVHVVYLLDFMIIFILLVTMKRNQWKRQLIIQMVPILIGFFLDASVYYQHWQLGTSDSSFTAVGIIIFLISELFHVWKYSIEVYTESVRSQAYRQMAYVDALTGIGNRRAFDMERNAIDADKREFQSILVASVDVNDLKRTNDTSGHAAGDFLIRSAADVLADLAEQYGNAFRIGGDEFIVLLYDMEQTEFDRRIDRMNQQISDINSCSTIKLSLSLGYEVSCGDNLEAALEEADRKMYINKAIYKSQKAQALQMKLH